MLIGYRLSYDKKVEKKNECVVSTADDETILYITEKKTKEIVTILRKIVLVTHTYITNVNIH